MGIDANNEFYPLAYGVASVENNENWLWFMQKLRECIPEASEGVEEGELTRPLTFMSNRQKGLITAVATIWPDAHHGHCLRHLVANFKD